MPKEKPYEFTTSETLLRDLAASPESRRWEQFYHLYKPVLSHYLTYLLGAYPDGRRWHDDIVQETFIALAKQLPAFVYDPAKGRFRDYIGRILGNKLKDFQRRSCRSAAVETHLDDIEAIPDRATARPSPDAMNEALAQLLRLVERRLFASGRFSGRTEAVYRRLAVDGQPPEAVAREFNITPNNAYQIKKRVADAIAAEMARLRRDGNDLFDILEIMIREDLP